MSCFLISEIFEVCTINQLIFLGVNGPAFDLLAFDKLFITQTRSLF